MTPPSAGASSHTSSPQLVDSCCTSAAAEPAAHTMACSLRGPPRRVSAREAGDARRRDGTRRARCCGRDERVSAAQGLAVAAAHECEQQRGEGHGRGRQHGQADRALCGGE
jgi:hypothetical protein